MRVRVAAVCAALVAAWAAAASAQAPSMSSTTLGGAMDAQYQTVTLPVASTVGVQVGFYAFADRETMLVRAVNAGPSTLTVQRAYAGAIGAHASGTTLYYGPPDQFHREDPLSQSCLTNGTLTPYVNMATGALWFCGSPTPLQTGAAQAIGVWAPSYAPYPQPTGVAYSGQVTAPLFGSTNQATRIETSLAAPASSVNGDFWVQCVGTSPARTCSLMLQDNGVVRTMFSFTY